MKKKISKFFSRRWLAFIVASAALFAGKLDGWSWVVFALAFVGLLTFEKANLSSLSKIGTLTTSIVPYTSVESVEESTETEGD